MNTYVKIIVPFIIALLIIFLIVIKKSNEKFDTQPGNGDYPSYYVYKKIDRPFSDKNTGRSTKSLPDIKNETNRIEKEPYRSCEQYCH